MARHIRGNYYEDNYVKHGCGDCRKTFIVGEAMSGGAVLACPYCRSEALAMTALADEECSENMDMGCLGIYFHRYTDGNLMLITEAEFGKAMRKYKQELNNGALPIADTCDIIAKFCAKRDGRTLQIKNAYL